MKDKDKAIKITTLSFIVIMGLIITYLFVYEAPYNGEIVVQDTLIFGHGGFGDYAPENSLSAIELAMDSGLDGIELDVQLTLDKEVIIFHDSDLDRLTNGMGPIKNKNLEEIKSLEYGSIFNVSFSDRIITLEEVFEKVDGQILIMLEIKCGKISCDGIEKKISDLISKYDAYSYVYVDSFNPFTLYRIKKENKGIKTIFDFRDIETYDSTNKLKLPFLLKSESFRRGIRKIIKPDLLSAETTVKESTINNLKSKGYPVIFWTPNTVSEITDSLNKNPFAILTDEPKLALEIRGKE